MSESVVLLVISYDANYYEIFKNVTLLDGKKVIVEQTRWKYLHVESGSREGCYVWCKKDDEPYPWTSQKEDRSVKPDFLFCRNFPTDLHDFNFRPIVIGLSVARIGSVNCLESILRTMDRPIVHAELLKIRDIHGFDKFPIIDVIYHSNGMHGTKERNIKLNYPVVLKVGTVHAGFGKYVIKDDSTYDDIEGLIALHNDYFTQEPFIEHDYEFRVQAIGPHVRCFKRNSDSGWKNNWGNVRFEDHPWEEKYGFWVDETRKLFGGLDMFALDILHGKDGIDYIIELNDGAMGLDYAFEEEDIQHMKELVIQRMNEKFCPDICEPQNYVGQYIVGKGRSE